MTSNVGRAQHMLNCERLSCRCFVLSTPSPDNILLLLRLHAADLTQIEDTEPLPRWGHLAVTVGSKVFVWGGEGSTEEDRKFLRFFDMDTRKWWKRRTKGSPPQGYIACAYALIGKVLYVFGGSWERRKGCAYTLIRKIFGSQIYYNDIYRVELDLEATTLQWKKCKVLNRKQGPMKKRSTGMMARKTKNNSVELVVFGGYGAPQKGTLPGSSIHRTNEVHTFNTETGEWTAQVFGSQKQWDSFSFTKIDDRHAVVIAGVQQGPGAVNCVHCLQLNESATTGDPEWSWVSVKTTGEAGVPAKRRDHATVLLSTTEHYTCLFMTGGIDKKWHSLGDAWILNLQRDGENITQGSWLKVVGRHEDLKVADNTADGPADKADPLRPRFSLTANKCKCESNESWKSFHLMIFGGIPKNGDPAIAETKVLTLDCMYTKEGSISSGKLSV